MEHDDKVTAFFRFEDLRVYHKAMEYAHWVYQVTGDFHEGIRGLRDHWQHAAATIAVSIAEGSARNKSQFVYYLKMSKTSIRECLVHGSSAAKLGLVTPLMEELSRNQLMELTKMLGALIGSLQRHVDHGHEEDEAMDDHFHPVR